MKPGHAGALAAADRRWVRDGRPEVRQPEWWVSQLGRGSLSALHVACMLQHAPKKFSSVHPDDFERGEEHPDVGSLRLIASDWQ